MIFTWRVEFLDSSDPPPYREWVAPLTFESEQDFVYVGPNGLAGPIADVIGVRRYFSTASALITITPKDQP